MTDMEILGAAIAYTNKCIAGAGGLKGANCTIKSIDPITGGNRITFEWEDNEGHTETSTMDVMDGADGQDGAPGADGQDGVSPTISVSTITGGHAVSITDAQGTNTFNVMDGIDGKDGKDGTNGTNGTDGVGIASITFKGTDASGNNIYTVNLSNNTSYDITCPKGPAGATGSTGPAGPGVASGGTPDQVLVKKSATDYDTDWKTLTKSDVGLSNVPNVATNDQTPTFSMAQTRANIVSGDTFSTILGKISKFFNDLKTVAFTGSFSDLSNKPENSNTFQGTIAEWNQLSTAEKKAYDHASISDSLDGNVTFPASKVMMLDGDSVEDSLDEIAGAMLKAIEIPYSDFTWDSVSNRFKIENYTPTVEHLLGYLVTWENGAVASMIYHNTSASYLVIGGIIAGGAAITSNFQFKCFEIGF